MTDNPDYGIILFDLLTKAEGGDAAPLNAYLAAIKQDFGKGEAPRLLGAAFCHDGIVHMSIDDGFESSVSADLELGTDGNLRLIEIDDN